jgi:predicted aminopeptidase
LNVLSRLRFAAVLALAVALGSCGTGYYLQAITGQAALMRAREPLEQVLADPATPGSVRRQLLVVDAALLFARLELGLPATKSYRHYADIGRTSVVWNVFAAPEFSLEPRQWCYPVAGCATYRGWFSERKARDFAASLAARGDDVFVGGVAAYSTLGWFADPVLNTMLGDSDAGIAGLLFHELAHQLVYLAGDTLFNEGFASLVEEEGTRRWLVSRNDAAGLCEFRLRQSRRLAALDILAGLKLDLADVYSADMPRERRRQLRAAAVARSRALYAVLRAGWTKPPWFDAWFDPGLNNARLAALSSYEDYVPAFRALLARQDGDLERFYTAVGDLARDPPEARELVLRELSLEQSGSVNDAPASRSCL